MYKLSNIKIEKSIKIHPPPAFLVSDGCSVFCFQCLNKMALLEAVENIIQKN